MDDDTVKEVIVKQKKSITKNALRILLFSNLYLYLWFCVGLAGFDFLDDVNPFLFNISFPVFLLIAYISEGVYFFTMRGKDLPISRIEGYGVSILTALGIVFGPIVLFIMLLIWVLGG